MKFQQNPDHDLQAKNKEGNLIPSDNNKDREVAFIFSEREEIKRKGVELVEASMLNEEEQVLFKTAIDAVINEIEEEASSLGVRDQDAYHYAYRYLRHLELARPENLSDATKKEWGEVAIAFARMFNELCSYKNFESWRTLQWETHTS